MFSSSKVSQAMIDAVNSVLSQTKPEPVQEVKTPEEGGRVPFAPATPVTTLTEASEKVPTPTGMKVYGSSYGNSKKARADQTKSSVDTLKGPKDKEMKEAAKPDFLDMDKDGNKKESMKKAIADKNMKEELKGNQHKIDANNNDKIDSQDFAILRGKKKVKESLSFADRLLETIRKSDVPAYLRKAKGDTPLTVADVKGPKKDSISAPKTTPIPWFNKHLNISNKQSALQETESTKRDITDTESPEETKRRRAKDNREGKKALAQTSDATKKKLGLPPYDKE